MKVIGYAALEVYDPTAEPPPGTPTERGWLSRMPGLVTRSTGPGAGRRYVRAQCRCERLTSVPLRYWRSGGRKCPQSCIECRDAYRRRVRVLAPLQRIDTVEITAAEAETLYGTGSPMHLQALKGPVSILREHYERYMPKAKES